MSTNDILFRTQGANALKSAFNLMWDKAIHLNKSANSGEFVSYRDMVRIADAIRTEGPGILRVKKLPKRIDSGLYFAVSIADPNKARIKENIKKGYSTFGGMSGVALIAVCLGQVLNPGVWASVAVLFTGGIAAGPWAPIGIAAGIALLVGSVYIAVQKMSPIERAVKSHDIFMRSIDEWIKKGDAQDEAIADEPQRLMKDALPPAFTNEERDAALTLILKIAIMDGVISAEEKNVFDRASANKEFSRLDEAGALEVIKAMNLDKRREFLAWCFAISTADTPLDGEKATHLEKLSADLGVDYNSIASFYL